MTTASAIAGLVALENEVPVLPCFLHGTGEGQNGPVRLVVGHESRLQGDPEVATATLRSSIAALDPEATADMESRP